MVLELAALLFQIHTPAEVHLKSPLLHAKKGRKPSVGGGKQGERLQTQPGEKGDWYRDPALVGFGPRLICMRIVHGSVSGNRGSLQTSALVSAVEELIKGPGACSSSTPVGLHSCRT